MKQKLLYTLVLLYMSLCSSTVWAERERPAMPTASLESGNTYYLYNVEAGLFLGYDGTSTSVLGINENPLPIEISLLDNGAYNMRVTSITNGYIYSYDDYCHTNSSSYGSNSRYSYWAIAEDEANYLIQRSPLNTSYYNADQYLGWQGGSATSILANRPITDGVHWKLVTADGNGNRFAAAMKLYKALQMADAFVENGWNIDYYVDLYANRATADIEEMTQAAVNLRNGLNMSQGYQAPYWNEYPILWQTSEGAFGNNYDQTWTLPNNSYTSGTYFGRRLYNSEESSLSATVKIDEPSTFIYGLSGSTSNVTVTVYVDGVKTRELLNEQIDTYTTANSNNYTYTRYFEALEAGTHTIKWVFKSTANNSSRNCYIRNAGVMKSPLITVSLLEPGSLGTEVLYNTDHIKNVRRLKVKGKMNSDDWAKIKMMHYLQDLDLSEAEFTEIPEYQFSCAKDTSSLFIHAMKLPEGLEKINREAFYYSFIDHLDFPSTVTTVDRNAFSYSHLQELVLPNNLTDIKSSSSYFVFNNMYWLKKLVCPKNLTTIPYGTFFGNYYCTDVTLPEELTTISEYAFYENMRMTTTFPSKLKAIGERAFYHCQYANFSPLPESLESIGSYAFYNCNRITTLKIPENVSSIGSYAFQSCYYLTDVEIGTKIYNLSTSVFDNCTRLETLRLNSPTVVTYNTNSSQYPVSADHIKDVALIVPNHMVTSYKLDNYWYNFKSIEGFSTAEIQDWTLEGGLILNHDRLEGEPNLFIGGGGSLKINGETPMSFNNLTFWSDRNGFYGRLLSNCTNIDIKGALTVQYYTHTAKEWRFVSLPFDMKVGDITSNNPDAKYAIRYYDGANRAANGRSGSWKDYNTEEVIPAGSGFIFCSNMDRVTWYFKSLDNENKQLCVSNRDIVKTLDVNASENASNRGWNLVGNPWQCYYNDHMLNFTAPITVWNTLNKTYSAYSITDDDYAIRPNEAFFVQCPSAQFNTIGFPVGGRQLTDVIESQNAARPTSVSTRRMLVNVKISNGEAEDRTRVVLNENASMDYEMECDASKMMSMDASVAQIYSLDADDTQYAINERPVGNGVVQLGIYAGADGEYTLSLGRCDAENVVLIDYVTGTEQSLAMGYTFTARAGYDNGRFALRFNASEVTGIETVNNENTIANEPCYNLAGQRVVHSTKGVNIIGGRKVIVK